MSDERRVRGGIYGVRSSEIYEGAMLLRAFQVRKGSFVLYPFAYGQQVKFPSNRRNVVEFASVCYNGDFWSKFNIINVFLVKFPF